MTPVSFEVLVSVSGCMPQFEGDYVFGTFSSQIYQHQFWLQCRLFGCRFGDGVIFSMVIFGDGGIFSMAIFGGGSLFSMDMFGGGIIFPVVTFCFRLPLFVMASLF